VTEPELWDDLQLAESSHFAAMHWAEAAEERFLAAKAAYEAAYPMHGPRPEPTLWEQMLHAAYDTAISASLDRIWKTVTV
jgi:hypothetical protein